MMDGISIPIRKLQKKKTLFYSNIGHTKTKKFCLPNQKSNTTSLYCETTSYNFYPTVSMEKHPFQLYLSRSPFFYLCVDDDLIRTSSDN
jgi:hypothetical protein